MPDVIGFEGNPDATPGIAWGAAALDYGDSVVNAVTRLRVDKRDFERLVAERTVIVLPKPIAVSEQQAQQPLLGLRLESDAPRFAEVDALESGSIGKHIVARRAKYFLYASTEAYLQAVAEFNRELTEHILYSKADEQARADWVKCGLTLDRSDPILNAIWAYDRRGKSVAFQLASVNVGDNRKARMTFEDVYSALLEVETTRAELHYRGGEANRNHFALPTSQAVLTSFQNICSCAALQVQDVFPCLRDLQPPSVMQQPGSVRLLFDVEPQEGGASLGERLAMVLLWRQVENLLTSTEADDEEALARARRVVTSPTEGVFAELVVRDEPRKIVPPIRGVAEARWSKRLSKSDAQIATVGNDLPYLRLTRSDANFDHTTWFREELFGGLEWKAVSEEQPDTETATVRCETTIDGMYLGKLQFQLSHDPARSKHNRAPATWLHWNDTLKSILSSGFYAFHWATLERRQGRFLLNITARRPSRTEE